MLQSKLGGLLRRRPWTFWLFAFVAFYVVDDILVTYSLGPDKLHLPRPLSYIVLECWLYLCLLAPCQGIQLVMAADFYDRFRDQRTLREFIEMSLFLAMALPLVMLIGPKLDVIRERSSKWWRAPLWYVGVSLLLDIPIVASAYWP
jgi:hypothetical protein